MTYDSSNASYRDAAQGQQTKYTLTAYLLAVFFGVLGFHRFYLGLYKDGIIYFLGAVFGTLLLMPSDPAFLRIIGYVAIGIVVIAWIADLIRMPKLVAAANVRLKGEPASA